MDVNSFVDQELTECVSNTTSEKSWVIGILRSRSSMSSSDEI